MQNRGVFQFHSPSLSALSAIQESLVAALPIATSRWWFEYKLFRSSASSNGLLENDHLGLNSNSSTRANSLNQSNLLSIIKFSNNPSETFLLTKAGLTVLDGQFEALLTTRLQSLWTHRQTLKGEGNTYEFDDCIIKISNVQAGGAFKTFLVDVCLKDNFNYNRLNDNSVFNSLSSIINNNESSEKQDSANDRVSNFDLFAKKHSFPSYNIYFGDENIYGNEKQHVFLPHSPLSKCVANTGGETLGDRMIIARAYMGILRR